MHFFARRAPKLSFPCLVLAFAVVAMLEGCGRGSLSEKERIAEFYKTNPTQNKVPVARFAGRVTVDGMAPSGKGALYVILNDAKKFDPQPSKNPPPHFAVCDAEGKFEFMTYDPGDGVPVGNYVVTFVQLHHPESGAARRSFNRTITMVGPDELKNLYNDPEKNQNEKTFQVEIQPPGRTDYEFSLTVAGKDPIISPGKYSITRLTTM
ncbi:MAG TPA: hypothetical protein VEI07_05695 [Planctomycetaceae bacterium]|nr:hypothetical protein [Planctomycetaceae bacterium]